MTSSIWVEPPEAKIEKLKKICLQYVAEKKLSNAGNEMLDQLFDEMSMTLTLPEVSLTAQIYKLIKQTNNFYGDENVGLINRILGFFSLEMRISPANRFLLDAYVQAASWASSNTPNDVEYAVDHEIDRLQFLEEFILLIWQNNPVRDYSRLALLDELIPTKINFFSRHPELAENFVNYFRNVIFPLEINLFYTTNPIYQWATDKNRGWNDGVARSFADRVTQKIGECGINVRKELSEAQRNELRNGISAIAESLGFGGHEHIAGEVMAMIQGWRPVAVVQSEAKLDRPL